MTPGRELNETLERLRAELSGSNTLAPRERELLEELAADIAALLEDADASRHEPQSLVERLQEATAQFEQSHPSLTFAIGAVADALARLGI